MKPIDALQGLDAGSAPPAPRRFVGGTTDEQLDPLAAWWRQNAQGEAADQMATGRAAPSAPAVAAPLVSPAQVQQMRLQRSMAADAQRHANPDGSTDDATMRQLAAWAGQTPPAPVAVAAPVTPPVTPSGTFPGAQPPGQPTAEERAQQARVAAGAQMFSAGIGQMSRPYGAPSTFPSDERVKVAVQSAPPRQQDRAIDSLGGAKTWRYDRDAQRELGVDSDRHIGPMAQAVESTPLGELAVRDTPDGKMIDTQKALGMTMALVGRLGERVSDLEGGDDTRHDRALADYHRGGYALSDEYRKEAVQAVGKERVDAALGALAQGYDPARLEALLTDANRKLGEYQAVYGPDIEGRVAASGLRNEEGAPKHLLAQFTSGPEGETRFRDSAGEAMSIGRQEPSARLSVNQVIPRWQWDSPEQDYEIETQSVRAEQKAREDAAKAKEAAVQHYDRGVALTRAGDHTGAAAAFDAAHALVPHDVAASEAEAARARAGGVEVGSTTGAQATNGG